MRVVRTSLLTIALALLSVSAWAQTDVAFFLTPKVGTGADPFNAIRPKYTDAGALGVGLDLSGWTAMDYGLEDVFLVSAQITADQRTALQSMPDVLIVPVNLDNTVSAVALATIQAKLEALNLPGNWITTANTYRQVVKAFRRVITFMQRYRGEYQERLFGAGVTLDTKWNQLTATQQQRLRNIAAILQLDTTGITNTMTLRQILKQVADQLPDISMNGETV